MTDKILSYVMEVIYLHFPREFGEKYHKQTLFIRALALVANIIACIQLYDWHHYIVYEFYFPLPWSALAILLVFLGRMLYPVINIIFDVFCAVTLFRGPGWALNPRIYGRWSGSWVTLSMSILFSFTAYLHCVLTVREIFRMIRFTRKRNVSIEDGVSLE